MLTFPVLATQFIKSCLTFTQLLEAFWYNRRMDENTINDLKDFISTVITNQTTDLVDRINVVDKRVDSLDKKVDVLDKKVAVVDKKVDVLDKKVDNLSLSVAEALDTSNEANDAQLKDHEKRISKLEHSVA